MVQGQDIEGILTFNRCVSARRRLLNSVRPGSPDIFWYNQNHGRYSRSLQRVVEYCILTRTRPSIVGLPRLLSTLQLR